MPLNRFSIEDLDHSVAGRDAHVADGQALVAHVDVELTRNLVKEASLD